MRLLHSRQQLIAGAALALIVVVSVASCSSSGLDTKPAGGAASIAQAQARATATAEVIQTATAQYVDSQARIRIAETRQAEIANGVIQSTLTAQDQQINDLVITGAKAQLTAQAVNYQETAAAIVVQKTATAEAVAIQKTLAAEAIEATRRAVVDAAAGRESSNRFWGWVGLILVVLLAAVTLLLVGGFVLLGWRFVTRNSYIPHPNGNGGVVVSYSPWDLLNRHGVLPQYELLLPAAADLASANPNADQESGQNLTISYGKTNSRVSATYTPSGQRVVSPEQAKAEAAWKKATADVLEFVTNIYEYRRENGSLDERTIPRWKLLESVDPTMNGRKWTDMTDLLYEVGAILQKEQGKETRLSEKYKTVGDLAIAAGRGKLLPPTPTSGWLKKQKLLWNTGNSYSSEHSEQLEQSVHPAYVDPDWSAGPDDAVWALPGTDR